LLYGIVRVERRIMANKPLVIELRNREHIAAERSIYVYALDPPPLHVLEHSLSARLIELPN